MNSNRRLVRQEKSISITRVRAYSDSILGTERRLRIQALSLQDYFTKKWRQICFKISLKQAAMKIFTFSCIRSPGDDDFFHFVQDYLAIIITLGLNMNVI